MSDLPLADYARDLVADVLATAEAESTTAPETFTRRTLDDLEQAGVTENTFTAYYRAHGVEVSGYGSNDSLGTLDLFITSFRQFPLEAGCPVRGRYAAPAPVRIRPPVPRGPPSVHRRSLRRLRHVPGRGKTAPGGTAAQAFSAHEQHHNSHRAPRLHFDDLPISYEVWDLTRLHRMATSGTLSEPIIADFEDPLPCLATPGPTGTSRCSWPSCRARRCPPCTASTAPGCWS